MKHVERSTFFLENSMLGVPHGRVNEGMRGKQNQQTNDQNRFRPDFAFPHETLRIPLFETY